MTKPITESHDTHAAKYANGSKPVLLPEWVARRRGQDALVVVLPEPAELFLDIDDETDLKVMDGVLGILAGAGFKVIKAKEIRSKSGLIHVYLKAPRELTEVERIALQACLGSDRTREALSFVRYVDGKYAATLFFEPVVTNRSLHT